MVKIYLRSYNWSLWNQVDELLNVEDDGLVRMSNSSMHMEAHRLDLSPQNTHLIFSGTFKLSENISRYFTNILLTSNYFQPVQPKDPDADFPSIEPRSTFPIFLMSVYFPVIFFAFHWYLPNISLELNLDKLSPFSSCQFISLSFSWYFFGI